MDVDVSGLNRAKVLEHIRSIYGQEHVANVLTLRTEKSKSAILAAARGLGIDVDIAQYIASLIPAERGMLWSLNDCMYGNESDDRQPIKQFVYEMTTNYPEIWNVVQKTEGLIVGMGEHAGGVIFTDKPFTDSTALMRAPNGDVMTQFELHTCESASLIKMDLLSVEAIDKIQICIDLLCQYGYVQPEQTLRQTYEKVIGIYNIERDDPNMWKMVWEHKIGSLFQMTAQSGINGIELVHPESVDDLATLNSVIRLMSQEKGGEMPVNKFARFKKDINLWYQEMRDFGLTEEEIKVLEPIVKISYGICESQEGFMQLVQIPECGGFDLTWSDRLRKSIAKKNPKAFLELEKEYYDNMIEKHLSKPLCRYVWQVLVAYSRGYGFNKSHTLAYSLIALQEMNLAYKYPTIFWNCACLISDAGGNEQFEDEDEQGIEENKIEEPYYEEMEWFDDDEDTEVSSYEEDDGENGYPATIVVTESGKKKKKAKVTNYGKVAAAIGRMKSEGIEIMPPSINHSSFTFSPDVEHNAILYGLSGITRINESIIKQIINNRPYMSVNDFLENVKLNKTQMINLIKSGALDEFGDRMELMKDYIWSIADTKKKLNGQNINMLINVGLIPEELDLEKRTFNFNKYLKKLDYHFDEVALKFYEQHFDMDRVSSDENGMYIDAGKWKVIYDNQMLHIKNYIKANHDELLEKLNNNNFMEEWNKYCLGNISKWEMDSISCYYHEHELANVNLELYDFCEFYDMSDEPEIDYIANIKGKKVPIFKIKRIVGTVLDRDKNKKTITLLTLRGVVTVKIYGGVFSQYDKQISEKGLDGKKHVIEKSLFARGNKIIISGIRSGENEFLGKKYSKTPWHMVERIVDVNSDNTLIIQHDRAGVDV